jgi:hypothetical protein
MREASERVFRPLWATAAGLFFGALGVIVTLNVVFGANAPGSDATVNRVLFLVLVAGIFWLMWRLGGVYAKAKPDGLLVRNVIRSRWLEWPQIIAVRMNPADSWVILDLADGTTLAVMAIQRADGNRGIAQARRLAALVRARGEAAEG